MQKNKTSENWYEEKWILTESLKIQSSLKFWIISLDLIFNKNFNNCFKSKYLMKEITNVIMIFLLNF